MISAYWYTSGGWLETCYGDTAPDAALTFHFVGSPTSLTLHGRMTKAGEYYYYDSL